jgi:hypothetical protein
MEPLNPKETSAAALTAQVAAGEQPPIQNPVITSSVKPTADDVTMGGHGFGAGGDIWAIWDAVGELSRVALQVNSLTLAKDAAKKALLSRSMLISIIQLSLSLFLSLWITLSIELMDHFLHDQVLVCVEVGFWLSLHWLNCKFKLLIKLILESQLQPKLQCIAASNC